MGKQAMMESKKAKRSQAPAESMTETVKVSAPWRFVRGMRAPTNLRIGRLNPRQALALWCIRNGLHTEGEEVQLGRKHLVDRHTDAIRWLLDAAADAMSVPENYPHEEYEG